MKLQDMNEGQVGKFIEKLLENNGFHGAMCTKIHVDDGVIDGLKVGTIELIFDYLPCSEEELGPSGSTMGLMNQTKAIHGHDPMTGDSW